MERETVLILSEGLRVFVRNAQVNTHVLIEVDGAYIVQLDVDKWNEFVKAAGSICHEFHRRFDTPVGYPEIEYENVLRITNGLRILLRNTGQNTYVMIETDGTFIITLNAEKWMKLKTNIAVIEQEYYRRFNYQYIENIHPEEKELAGEAARAD